MSGTGRGGRAIGKERGSELPLAEQASFGREETEWASIFRPKDVIIQRVEFTPSRFLDVPLKLLIHYKYPALAAAACILITGLLLIFRAAQKPEPPPTLGGKWVGTVVWNDASGQPYRQSFRTALFFLPHNVCGIVITFPTGAIGGAGRYTLQGHRLTVTCGSLSVNGRPLPLSTFSQAAWYHAAAVYALAYNSERLTLTPDKEPTPAPCWPLRVSPKPIVLSRIAPPDAPAAPSTPGE